MRAKIGVNVDEFYIWDALQQDRGHYKGQSKRCHVHNGCRELMVTWPDNEVTEVCSTRIVPVKGHLKVNSLYKDDYRIAHGER